MKGFKKNSKKQNSKRGKKARASGARFELKVRNDLEKRGWNVSKWMNNVELENNNRAGKLIPAKRKYNPFFRALSIGTGFPDFIAFKSSGKKYNITGVEVKRNGYLDKTEKEKCRWLLKNQIFSKILIAKKGKKRGEIEYLDFEKKYSL